MTEPINLKDVPITDLVKELQRRIDEVRTAQETLGLVQQNAEPEPRPTATAKSLGPRISSLVQRRRHLASRLKKQGEKYEKHPEYVELTKHLEELQRKNKDLRREWRRQYRRK